MGPALPLGISSDHELFAAKFHTNLSPEEIFSRTNQFIPDYLGISHAAELPASPVTSDWKAALPEKVTFRIAVTDISPRFLSREALDKRLTDFKGATHFISTRERKKRRGGVKEQTIDLKAHTLSLDILGDRIGPISAILEMSLRTSNGGQCASPYAILEGILELSQHEARDVPITKVTSTI